MTEVKHQRTVEDGVLTAVSPSQIDQFISCPTLWYFNKVERIKIESTIEQDEGILMHAQMEKYYVNGIKPEHPSCLAALDLPGLPKPGAHNIHVEQPNDYNTGMLMSGVPVKAKLDLRWNEGELVHIRDWKSCKNYVFNKTPDELARNPQGVIYMAYGFEKHQKAEYATFGHVYLKKTGGGGAKAVVTDQLSRSHVRSVFSELENVVREMKETARIPNAKDVRYNKSRCGAFGGCPYKNVCPVWTTKRVSVGIDMDALLGLDAPAKTQNKPMSLKDLITAYKRGDVIEPSPVTSSSAIKTKRSGPQDPHLPEPFPLVTEQVTDSFINPPDAREPYEVKPWYPNEDKT